MPHRDADLNEQALRSHAEPRPGRIGARVTEPAEARRDLDIDRFDIEIGGRRGPRALATPLSRLSGRPQNTMVAPGLLARPKEHGAMPASAH